MYWYSKEKLYFDHKPSSYRDQGKKKNNKLIHIQFIQFIIISNKYTKTIYTTRVWH